MKTKSNNTISILAVIISIAAIVISIYSHSLIQKKQSVESMTDSKKELMEKDRAVQSAVSRLQCGNRIELFQPTYVYLQDRLKNLHGMLRLGDSLYRVYKQNDGSYIMSLMSSNIHSVYLNDSIALLSEYYTVHEKIRDGRVDSMMVINKVCK